MTLKELHELIGKVLKERPELATKEVAVCTESDEEPFKDLGFVYDTIYLRGISSSNEEGEFVWQSKPLTDKQQ